MDNFSFYKLNNKFTPFHEQKNSPKLRDCQIFNVIKGFGVFKPRCSLISKTIKYYLLISYISNPEKVSDYHIGSAFKKHYYVCYVLVVLKDVRSCFLRTFLDRSSFFPQFCIIFHFFWQIQVLKCQLNYIQIKKCDKIPYNKIRWGTMFCGGRLFRKNC